ncbi:MAG: hypothetical protein WC285_01665 [Candidatus Gracilibacteria bacterium]|jgi:hypothetical protein
MTTPRRQEGEEVLEEVKPGEALPTEATAEGADGEAEEAIVTETAATTGEAVTAVTNPEILRRVNLMVDEVIPAAETSFQVDRDPNYRRDGHGGIRQNAPDDLANYFESWLVFGGPLAHAAARQVIGKLIEKEKGLTREQGFPGHRRAFIRAIAEMLDTRHFKDPYNAFEVLRNVIDTFGLSYAKEILRQRARVEKLPDGDKVIAYAEAKLDEDAQDTARILREVGAKLGKEAAEKLHVDVWSRDQNLGLR